MKKIHESLLVLSKCHRNIELNWEAIEKYRDIGALQSLYHFTYNLSYYILLETTVFLEEYDKVFAGPDNEPEIIQRAKVVKDICKPIYKRLKSFKSLRNLRNDIIAHPWRQKKQFVVPQDPQYSIPRSWFEYQLLKDYLSYIYRIIEQEFSTEMAEAQWQEMQLRQSVRPVRVNFDEVNADTKALLKEVEALSSRYQRDYTITFCTYHKPENL